LILNAVFRLDPGTNLTCRSWLRIPVIVNGQSVRS
jgi:hypothetical protein